MKNMRVSLKLIVAFLVVIVLAVGVGIVGIIGMYNMNIGDDKLYEGNYLPTIMAGDISQAIAEQRVYFRNFVIYDVNLDADTFRSSKTNLDNSKSNLDKLFAEYNDTIILQEDQNAFDELVRVYKNEWLPMLDTVYNYGVANQLNDAKEALTSASSIASKLDDLTTKLQDINIADGQSTVEANTSMFNTMTVVEIVALIASVGIAMFFAFYVSSLISKPLAVLTAFMKKASSTGDINLTREDEEQIRIFSVVQDEVGQCIASTAAFIDRLHTIGDALQTVADGDLTTELSLLSESDTMGLSLNKMMDNLNSMFSEINNATMQVATGSKQIADGSQSLAQGSTEQAAAVEELSSSIAEIAEKTRENAQMADKAATLANAIMGNAEKGSRQMDEMMAAVKEINQASQSINKVIKVIDDIAFQTNILALNAAVEAARAGQHGKGFAVVAEEVRNLAAKSAEAAKDTGSLIANSMEKAELGARIADETATSLNDIVLGINESTQLVDDIAKSSEEQSTGISQINKGIDQVAQVVQQNSATAQESAAASQEMSGQSDMLQGLVAQFKIKSGNNYGRMSSSASSVRMLPNASHGSYATASEHGEYGKY